MTLPSDVEVGGIPDVLSVFGLGAPIEIVPIREGLSNHNYAVRTDQDEYVVKFLVAQTDATVENDVAIQRQLRNAGIGTPLYLPNVEGKHLYRGSNNIRAVISKKIDGVTPRRVTARLAADIGRHLAIFHTQVRALPHTNNAGLLNPAAAVVDSDAVRAVAAQSLPRGIIHGDLHSGNVLVDARRPDSVVAIMDFEEAGENLFLLDLAVTVMATFTEDAWEPRFEPDLMRAAIQGYESVRVLTDDEYIWLPHAIGYASEAWINWFMASGHQRYARIRRRLYDEFRIWWNQETDE